MQKVFLTRRNLETLLSKLDRKKKGEQTLCSIVKRDTVHPKYPCTDEIMVTALENEEYYDRPAGSVFPADASVLSGQEH